MNLKLEVPYGGRRISLDIPDHNLFQIMTPRDHRPLEDLEGMVWQSLFAPYGQPPLWEWVRPSDTVVILSDDNTRATPTRRLLPPLLNLLREAGVRDSSISIVMALGTHRPMSKEEMMAKLGEEIFSRYKVLNHNWMDSAQLVDMGYSTRGTPIIVNKAVLEADIVIGVGSILPHHIAGFSGSSKIVQPGICGEKTTAETHLLSAKAHETLLGLEDNPVRRDMDEMAEKVGLRAILNVVMTRTGEVAGVFWGDMKVAFREGVRLAKEIYGIPFSESADIVIANSFPCEMDFWQSHKSLYPAAKIVKKGGTIILLTPAPEGVSPVHKEILGFTALTPEEIEGAYREGRIGDGVGAALAVAWAKVRQKATVIMVSEGIEPREKELLGFLHAGDISAALEMSFRSHGKEAKVCVLTHAAETLPLGPSSKPE